jgi:hypothetical protein
VLLIGETGSGKTTLFNGIPNFLFSIQWLDSCRLKAVTENEEQQDHDDPKRPRNQAESQTNYITVYRFNWQPGMACDYNLDVIDTPGFGDTRGIAHDHEIMERLAFLFREKNLVNLDQLDAIALVVPASDVRLTATRKYIFDSILSIFGKDAVRNMLIMVTFADGGEPQVMHAIRAQNIPHQTVLQFNNSALFGRTTGDGSNFGRQFWEMGTKAYADFFNLLFSLQPQSLSLTREVLRERQCLQVAIQAIHRLITEGIAELDCMEQEERALRQHKLDIEANRDFKITVNAQVPEAKPSPPGLHVTNCIICNRTCHHGCAFSDDADKRMCIAMDQRGYCMHCPKKCAWSEHKNQPHYWTYKIVAKQRTAAELKAKYTDATSKQATSQGLIANLKKKYNAIKDKVRQNVETVRQHVNRQAKLPLVQIHCRRLTTSIC